MTFISGHILLDKYRIEKLIGEGAFAEVYLATHIELNVPRALKILRKEAPGVGSSEFEDFRERFKLEVQLGSQINHPNVVQVHDFERDGDTLILVMEYCPSGSLAERIQTASEANQPIPVEEAINIGLDVSEGLAVIHEMDIVHRDLKPGNIMFGAQGKAKIADLGLAQIKGGPSMRSKLSLATPHPGTPSYMSPEQASQSGYLKPASDVYTLGLVLFESLTGRNYNNLKPGTHVKRYRPDMPGWLVRLLSKMLSKSEEERPWDGGEVSNIFRKNLQPDKSKIFMTIGGILIVLFITFGILLFNGSNYYTSIKPATQIDLLPPTRLESSPVDQNTPTISDSQIELSTTARSTQISAELSTTTTSTITALNTSTQTIDPTPTLSSQPQPKETRTEQPISIKTPVVSIDPMKLAVVNTLDGHTGSVNSIDFSPKGDLLVTGSNDNTVRIWDIESGSLLSTLEGHTDNVTSVIFSKGDDLVFSGSLDGSVKIWTTENGRLMHELGNNASPVKSLAISPNGEFLAVGYEGAPVEIWALADRSLYTTLEKCTTTMYGGYWEANALSFSLSSDTLAIPTSPKISLCTISEDRVVTEFEGHIILSDMPGTVSYTQVKSLKFLSNEEFLVSSTITDMRLWNTLDGEIIQIFKQCKGSIALSPDEKLIASGAGENLRICNASDGTALRNLIGHENNITSIAYSSDGSLIASGSANGTILLWGEK